MTTEDVNNNETTVEEGEGEVKIEVEDGHTTDPSLDEEAMVEAAIRAGEEAAEAELNQEALSQVEALKAEIEDLRSRNEELENSLEDADKTASMATERLARTQADWENFRRRVRQEREVERERATEKLVMGLLPVLDDMERAIDHARNQEDACDQLLQFVDGLGQIHDKMLTTFGKEGVEVINPAGEAFEPLSHQAVGRVEDTEAFDETVAQVYQPGYRMGGKVIRPAMVTVTYGGPKRPAAEEESADK